MRAESGGPLVLGAFIVVAVAACIPEDPLAMDPPRDCSLEGQMTWVDEVFTRFYLWNEQYVVPDHDEFDDIVDYVRAARLDEYDRWSRATLESVSDALYQEGKFVGFGFSTRTDPQGRLRLSDVVVDSPAWQVGMRRGHEILSINEHPVDVIESEDLWNEVYGPNEPGVSAEFEFREPGGDTIAASLAKDWVQTITVPVVESFESSSGAVGYVHFNRFLDPSFDELDEAFAELGDADVRHLVLDFRYNSGGLIDVARFLINLVVGHAAAGEVSYEMRYNDDYSSENVTRTIEAVNNSLDVDSVVILTSLTTKSSAELVMIALEPWVDVTVVGTTTGGKPVGMKNYDFCDYVLAPIMFRFVNAAGKTDYFEGLPPDCEADDDFEHQLGDPEEGLLAAGLGVIEHGDCPAPDAAGDPLGSLAPTIHGMPGDGFRVDEIGWW
jgi:C-terminal processing protease CtpA/Prc